MEFFYSADPSATVGMTGGVAMAVEDICFNNAKKYFMMTLP